VNIGDYDNPIELREGIDGVDLFMITDSPHDYSFWKVIPPMMRMSSKRKTSRHPKINSHLYFPDYDYTIYVDSNMFINVHPKFLIENFLHKRDIALHKNPYRSCIYDEAREIRDVLKYEDPKIVDAQVEHIRNQGYPENNGLSACHLILRKNSPRISFLNDVWWSMVCNYSYRDQLSFNFACWKTYTKYQIIEPYKEYIYEQSHKRKRVIFK
jgi:hypothetical protein